ncbi:MAG TPA: MarR family transcriptional regulator [Erysipelothrix sp.]
MSHDARHVVNELIVDIFKNILDLEEKYHQLHGIELSMTEIHTLDSIQKNKTKPMSDVAKSLNVTQGTLTTTVKRLEQKGFVKRVKDDKDRRINRLELQDSAYSVLKIHEQFHEEMIAGVLQQGEVNPELIQSIKNLNEFFKTIDKK